MTACKRAMRLKRARTQWQVWAHRPGADRFMLVGWCKSEMRAVAQRDRRIAAGEIAECREVDA